MTTYQIGSNVADFPRGQFHPAVNKDPYLGWCAYCGRKVGNDPKLIRFDQAGSIDPQADSDTGYLFAIGNECAKNFNEEVFTTKKGQSK